MKKLKPKISEETDKFIEVEIPEGKRDEYDLQGYEKSGNGEDFGGNYFEYFIKLKIEEETKMKKLCGCVSKDGKEIDGEEFEIETLKDLIEILKHNKEIHLNYFQDEEELNLWIGLN